MTQPHETWLGGFDGAFGSAAAEKPVDGPVKTDAASWVLLRRLDENGGVQRFPVYSQPFTIGRHPDNTVNIANGSVSGHHAEIIVAGAELLVRDRNSTNGTLLNGRRLQSVEVLREGDILHFGNVMFTLQKDSAGGQISTMTSDVGDAVGQVQFNTLMSRPGVEPHFQPIIRMDGLERVGFEVLSRSRFIGLETPEKMFRAAAQCSSEAALSRICRLEGMRASMSLDRNMQFYLNTHSAELNHQDLIESVRRLRTCHPQSRIVLEVHQSGTTAVDFLRQLRDVLNELEIGLAYDGFGVGPARLTELIEVPPDVLKFDVQLVHGLLTASEARRSTISGLIRMVKDLNVVPLAVGIENQEESEICCEMGFELAQGFLFGKAKPASKWVSD